MEIKYFHACLVEVSYHWYIYIGDNFHQNWSTIKIVILGTSLVVQWLRICIAMQKMWVQPLVWKLRSHMLQDNQACRLQLLSPLAAMKTQRSKNKAKNLSFFFVRYFPESYPGEVCLFWGLISYIWEIAPESGVESASQVALVVKNPTSNAGDERDVGSVLGSGRPPGGGHGNSLPYSCLENPMDRGAWRTVVHGVTRSYSAHLHMGWKNIISFSVICCFHNF